MKKCEITKFPSCSYMMREGLNTLGTNLSFAGADVKRIMITSSVSGEGKSTVSMNLMRTMSETGFRVVLLDVDLRKSRLSENYGFKYPEGENLGLAHFLAGRCSMDEILYETNLKDAFFIPVGREVKNSVRLLNSPLLGELLEGLKDKFDYVLLDTPPIGMLIDAAHVAKCCDGTLLVVRFDMVSKKKLRTVVKQLENSGSPVIGTVLNAVPVDGIQSK